jgi:hypothetical protein
MLTWLIARYDFIDDIRVVLHGVTVVRDLSSEVL